ncbi:hypothetical protein [Sorangium sp. So ce1151]|uniref:hypothetical protein n=1 Tax=Sorangium sp. So ce1151 TaxID=3133332 RepID=UPI003F62D2AD
MRAHKQIQRLRVLLTTGVLCGSMQVAESFAQAEDQDLAAYHRREFAKACPNLEKRAQSPQGYANAATCYYWWAQSGEKSKWNNTVRMWSNANSLCPKESPCERKTKMYRDAALELVQTRDALEALEIEKFGDETTIAGYKEELDKAIASQEQTENALKDLAAKLNISEGEKTSPEMVEEIGKKIADLENERKRLNGLVAMKSAEVEKWKKEAEAWKRKAEAWKKKAEEEKLKAIKWQTMYYESLRDKSSES